MLPGRALIRDRFNAQQLSAKSGYVRVPSAAMAGFPEALCLSLQRVGIYVLAASRLCSAEGAGSTH